ncbi:unnamed protein product [Ambrosiozyma monospora]|uniref:Unnamed protein product n=1 Tax=Ambrosiozyma monospora TaxID=43982 RepID=A0ACB5U0S8_AMBMO|nr:unnamed protein product [Ambrosiozyma monospora]
MNLRLLLFQSASLWLSITTPSVQASQSPFDFQQIQQPSFQQPFFALGKFDAISEYDNINTYNLSHPTTNSTSGTLYALATQNDTIAVLKSDPFNGQKPTQLYSLDDDNLLAIVNGQPVVYNLNQLNSSELSGWSGSVDGTVQAVHVDSNNQLVYFGGDLTNGDYHGVVAYNYSSNEIVDTPFKGFNQDSIVKSILQYQQDTILFGGEFYALGNSSLQSYNTTHYNISSNSSFVDPNQLVPMKYSIFSSVNSQDSDTAKNIICPSSGSTWAINDNQLGSWTASLPFTVNPSKIRLYNSNSDDNGVHIFRIITVPSNSIMNLTYIDPESLDMKFCDAWCPLSQNSQLSANLTANGYDSSYEAPGLGNQSVIGFGTNYQEFEFYNNLSVERLTLQVMSYYGSHAELTGLELYQYGNAIYANASLNEPNCDSDGNSGVVSNLGDSSIDWSSYTDQDGTHLTTKITTSDINTQEGLKFTTNITTDGNYSIQVNTPGCTYDNTCAQRGSVNASFYAVTQNLI